MWRAMSAGPWLAAAEEARGGMEAAAKVGPPGICKRKCSNSLSVIPQIQPILLGLCPIMPNYAD